MIHDAILQESTGKKPTPLSLSLHRDSVPIDLGLLASQIAVCGYAVVQGAGHQRDQLAELATQFGNIQFHERSASDGVVEIESAPANGNTDAQFAGQGIAAFPFHTDGSYLDEIRQIDRDVFVRVNPPRGLVIQCVRPAQFGGNLVLCDGLAVSRAIQAESPRLFAELRRFDVASVCRGGRICTKFPVFGYGSLGLKVRFRSDHFLWADAAGKFAVEELVERYFQDESFQTEVEMIPGDMVIIDNHRMLHSRKAIVGDTPQGRLMRRIWIAAETEYLFARSGATAQQSYLEDATVDDYRTVSSPLPFRDRLQWPTVGGSSHVA